VEHETRYWLGKPHGAQKQDRLANTWLLIQNDVVKPRGAQNKIYALTRGSNIGGGTFWNSLT